MEYFITFLEGIITFISPCMLPMLPIYIAYFAGTSSGRKTLVNAAGFVSGFTMVFTALGAFAGTFGSLLKTHTAQINAVTGAVVLMFGFSYLGIIKLPFLNNGKRIQFTSKITGFFPAVLFGLVFSIGWTPCVGAFLGSAFMLAASSANSSKGVLLLLIFSAGLGVPFLLSALLIDKLKGTFDFIKRHYKAVNIISGTLLCVLGFSMMTGLFGRLIALLSP